MTPIRPLAALLLAPLALAGCFQDKERAAWSLYTAPRPLEVRQAEARYLFPAALYDGEQPQADPLLGALALEWSRAGTGPVQIAAAHPDAGQGLGLAARTQEALVRAGVPPERVQVQPVAASLFGQPAGVLIHFQRAEIVPPPCDQKPYGHGNWRGCAIDSVMAEMVARPKDLVAPEALGQADSISTADGIRRVLRERQPAAGETGLLQALQELTISQQ